MHICAVAAFRFFDASFDSPLFSAAVVAGLSGSLAMSVAMRDLKTSSAVRARRTARTVSSGAKAIAFRSCSLLSVGECSGGMNEDGNRRNGEVVLVLYGIVVERGKTCQHLVVGGTESLQSPAWNPGSEGW